MTSDGGSNDIVADRNTGGTATNGIADNGDSKKVADGAPKTKDTKNPNDDCPASPAPIPPPTSYQQTYLPQSTPQQAAGFFVYPHSQVTPEQPSPATPGYDVNSFLQQHAALGVHPALSNPFGTNQYGGLPQAPLSPTRSGGAIPPASPLFSRPSGVGVGAFEQQNQVEGSVLQRMSSVGAPPSPSITYMSPPLGSAPAASFSAMYQGYVGGISGSYGNSANGESTSQEDNTWSDRTQQQQSYPQASPSPQLQSQGLPMPYGARANRSYSFEEMLPPAMLDHQDQNNPSFSPYSSASGSSSTVYPHQPAWGYGSGEMYNPPQSPLQPRQMPGHFAHSPMMPAMPQMAHYGGPGGGMPYYPATSPGPPIQTTASNKGPDGANLFIFHIPNHFTNLDMYRLFCQYGNLLSVRIMVEKETGRSRGFGFVSYDSPDSAALAIKELNGFAIGNKRLKVQHKQIRAGDQQRSYNNSSNNGGYLRPELPHLPPTHSAGISTSSWYHAPKPVPPEASGGPHEVTANGQSLAQANDVDAKPDENTAAPISIGVQGEADRSRPGSAAMSPLTSLEPLRNALPDVAGHAGPVE